MTRKERAKAALAVTLIFCAIIAWVIWTFAGAGVVSTIHPGLALLWVIIWFPVSLFGFMYGYYSTT